MGTVLAWTRQLEDTGSIPPHLKTSEKKQSPSSQPALQDWRCFRVDLLTSVLTESVPGKEEKKRTEAEKKKVVVMQIPG